MVEGEARKRLLKDHPPDEQGLWVIRGEDPNCDLGGPHGEPELEAVEGIYRDVVEYALNLPGFFQWGAGGSIRRIRPKKVDADSTRRRLALEKQRDKLMAQVKEIERKLTEGA